MILRMMFYLLAGLCTALVAGLHDKAFCQDFPYSVPQAPEFDKRGNLRSHERSRQSSSKRSYQQAPRTESNGNGTDYRTERPYVPDDSMSEVFDPAYAPAAPIQPPPVRTPAAAASDPQYGRQSSQPPYSASYGPQQPPYPASSQPSQPPRMQGAQDCSQFPMLIARAQSDAEMQMTARRYLTCLMQNGWNQDQAKQHVIRTIETTYAARR